MVFSPLIKTALFVTVATSGVLLFGGLDSSAVLPLDHEAIRYETRPLTDPVTQAAERLKSGAVKLDYDPHTGYLPSLLKLLGLRVSSQVLVFSKTSFQSPRISPHTPRAIYHSDDVAVGYVKSGDVLEITSIDPVAGPIFFTLDTEQVAQPAIVRRVANCLQCHATGATLGVPGLMVRSVFPGADGAPMFQAGSFVTDHRSPLAERWGGWYVTGTSGSQDHMGNAVVESGGKPESIVGAGKNVTVLKYRFDEASYLSTQSDIVSLMVLEHQTRMINLITRVGYETRLALFDQSAMNKAEGAPEGQMRDSTRHRVESACEELLRYMLFTEETPLKSEVKGTSPFASEFAAQGPRDHLGRSLRDFDLKRRMFRYPCSYLIYSEQYRQLPDVARQYIETRLQQILSGKDQSKAFANLSAEDRQNILTILEETRSGIHRS